METSIMDNIILVPTCAAGLCDTCPVAMQPFSFAPVYCDARHGLYEVTLYKGQLRQKRHYADDERVHALRKAVNFQTITENGEIYLLGFRRKE